MSSMKGGFSTLNRWFGRKKDKSSSGNSSIGKLSKSTTQLHHLSTDTDINETSQLEYNRITPVPAATSNAPFEQTFRITVLLPKDQLFVARLGARVPLSKLLALVCDNKQLDAEKYEFRSPVDASQVYSCESTIGAVGLSEIRLCHKSESYDNFNPDAMHKFHRTGIARDSLSSSSDFSSSRNSKITAKTPSPYSSSNSLNSTPSMDSTGMNYTRTPVVPPAKVLAPPPRKKRAAPRPPSQICIPEQSVPEIPSNPPPATVAAPAPAPLKSEPAYAVIVKRPQLHMSTPNLSGNPELDCNGNSAKGVIRQELDSPDGHYATLDLKPLPGSGGPEPTPRKRLIQIKKKTAPAPPPEHLSGGDTVSLASLPEVVTPSTPVNGNVPQPAPRITTPLPVASSPPVLENGMAATQNGNVSKVLLNRTPTPEPRSLGSAADEDDNDAASKQADSGIGEPAPSPSPEPEVELDLETKSQQESSSEDDEAIKVYNFKLCKTSSSKVEPPVATSLAELAALNKEEDPTEEEEPAVATPNGNLATPGSTSELTSLSSWNYSVPISPPPDFSDSRASQAKASAGNRSPGSPLDEIVDELSAIINQQKLDTLIRKQQESTEIEAAKPSRLANFSIATAKTTTRVTRADSFQAVTSPETPSASPGEGLSLRSTSHVSLNKLEQNGYPLGQRRSSSELSIGESPSLQSLEVIKTILNSRKNSLAESAGSSSPVAEQPKIPSPSVEQQLAKEPKNLVKDASPVAPPKPPLSSTVREKVVESPKPVQKVVTFPVVEKKDSPKPVQKVSASVVLESAPCGESQTGTTARACPETHCRQGAITTTRREASRRTILTSFTPEPCGPARAQSKARQKGGGGILAGSKPLPPSYRYSGPPSINFATWSERPKSQVAIKNEGDYIFGGAGKSQTVSPPPAKLTIEVASPILRMGIPQRKEYHVPITVKPLRDVVPEAPQETEEVAKKVEKVEVPATKPSQVQSSTLPRPAKTNRFTLPAGNHIQVVSTTSSSSASSSASNSLPRPVSSLERNKPVEATPTPFGQNTLRRTGFKERMLAKEQQEQDKARSSRVMVNGTSASPAPAAAPAPAPAKAPTPAPSVAPAAAPTTTSPPATSPKPVTFLKTNKVELKLKPETETETKPEAVTLQVKLRPTSQPAAVVAAVPPPPPPQLGLSLKPVVVKSKEAGRSASAGTTPTTPDPRSQLLEAIRNFKREELNRS
ncbi:LOW QUALITY PROTEIN: uncharacterized protein Dana_GF21956 [Drosophila ananassae]|uniref:WH2 domain-containing protein n=1 Tax=Drosophila ananassae TaxID=7217 RepID=B3MYV3_DROAN|nr:LOW QUALITY PROTEIN: uncharacterized protein Dana_GF21956 [Drosophila ananassae]